MKVLVANLGSTSLKMKLLEMDTEQQLGAFHLQRIGSCNSRLAYRGGGKEIIKSEVSAPTYERALRYGLEYFSDKKVGCLGSWAELDGIGFKAVHAGNFYGPALVTDEVVGLMRYYSQAAPSHNPIYIHAMQILKQILPDVPQVAFFETSFHRTMPDHAWIYSVPYEWYEKHGIRRYGFHSASFQYLTERATQLMGKSEAGLRLVACHLGGSSSICAIRDGASIDTSMGFTPQAGIPMGQRSGDFDPFVIPYILEKERMSGFELAEKLSTRGGLLGISGISGDVRDLEKATAQGNSRARLALEAYAYAVKKYIGGYAAALGGLDTLVFSGGIGENSPRMRARICDGLEFLGIKLSERANDACRGNEKRISKNGNCTAVWVIPTDEEIVVGRETARLLRKGL
jgi:acetate kinase